MAPLRYRCLVLDHDDTVVDSTAHVHHPAFLGIAARLRPGSPACAMTLEEYFAMNCQPGLLPYYRDVLGFSPAELAEEHRFWLDAVATRVPEVYPGMGAVIDAQKRRGGYVCVVSHSWRENILRDYAAANLAQPDLVYGSELPAERQKPRPWPLWDIMERLALAPGQLLMVDDLPLGLDMARAAGVTFAAAGWAHAIPAIQAEMERADLRFATPQALYDYLFGQ